MSAENTEWSVELTQGREAYSKMKLYYFCLSLIILSMSLLCTSGQVEMSESRESRIFGLDLDWNAIYENNFEPTNFFTILLQNLFPVAISAVAGIIFGPFYPVSYYDFYITFILYFRVQHLAARG